jgi:hypothetical protein
MNTIDTNPSLSGDYSIAGGADDARRRVVSKEFDNE